jgi:hypothetical protein
VKVKLKIGQLCECDPDTVQVQFDKAKIVVG